MGNDDVRFSIHVEISHGEPMRLRRHRDVLMRLGELILQIVVTQFKNPHEIAGIGRDDFGNSIGIEIVERDVPRRFVGHRRIRKCKSGERAEGAIAIAFENLHVSAAIGIRAPNREIGFAIVCKIACHNPARIVRGIKTFRDGCTLPITEHSVALIQQHGNFFAAFHCDDHIQLAVAIHITHRDFGRN